ncbi:MAG: hypothetical protein J6L85_07380 [Clostridia bacterium]|nr:hypothetical protein [Clostridia bacterium]
MSKTLNTIQTLVKIGRVIAKIVFVVTIIGAVGCLFGLGALIGAQSLGISVGSETLAGLIVNEAGMSMGSMYLACVSGMVMCIAEAVLAWLTIRYFNHELADGTPFTFSGAKELFRLGIINIAVLLGVSVLQTMIYGIFWIYFPEIEEIEASASLGTGIAMMILSVVFKHGAEITALNNGTYDENVKEEIKF